MACDEGLHARTAFSSATSSGSGDAGDSFKLASAGESRGVSTGVIQFLR